MNAPSAAPRPSEQNGIGPRRPPARRPYSPRPAPSYAENDDSSSPSDARGFSTRRRCSGVSAFIAWSIAAPTSVRSGQKRGARWRGLARYAERGRRRG